LAAPAIVLSQGGGSAAASSIARLPVDQIEAIMQTPGTVSGGVLDITQDRPELHVSGGTPGVPFVTGFQIQNETYWQSVGNNQAIVNGDAALTLDEIQPFIDGLLRHNIVFQAEHQHFYDLTPRVFFIHFRKTGDPIALAKDVHAVIASATSTPLPQKPPPHPTTPLPAQKLGAILGGSVDIGENGVVTVSVPRRSGVALGGVHVSPELNIANSIQFEPLGGGRAAAAPDFSMTADEVQAVMQVMRGFGWEVGCLYNQEIGEQPQLFFSHQFKVGDPIALAKEIRMGLDKTNAVS
jgi:hypothetical protein